MADGSVFQVCGAAAENARRANSVRVLAADSSGASEDRSGRTGTAGWIKSSMLASMMKAPSLDCGLGLPQGIMKKMGSPSPTRRGNFWGKGSPL